MTVPLSLSSVPAVLPYIQYVATGGQTVYPYPFPITQDADLVVVVNGVTQATDSGYTVSGQGTSTGGNVTFTLGRTAGDIITLFRNVTIQRLTQIGQNSGFSSAAFNAEFNNIYLILQQLQESITLSLQIPNTNSPAPVPVLTPGSYANKYLSFDANGNPAPTVLTSSGSLTQAIIGGLLNPQTAAEISTGAVPTLNAYSGLEVINVLRYGIVPNSAGAAGANTTALTALLNPSNTGPTGRLIFPNTTGADTYYFNNMMQVRDGIRMDLCGCTLNFAKTYAAADNFMGWFTFIRDVSIENGSLVVNYNGTGGTNAGPIMRIGSRSGYKFAGYASGIFDQDDLVGNGLAPMGNIVLRNLRLSTNNPAAAAAEMVLMFGGLRNVLVENIVLTGNGASGPQCGFYYEFGFSSKNGFPSTQAQWSSSHAHNLTFRNIWGYNLNTAGSDAFVVALVEPYSATCEGIHSDTCYGTLEFRIGEAHFFRPWSADATGAKRSLRAHNITSQGATGNAIFFGGSQATTSGYLSDANMTAAGLAVLTSSQKVDLMHFSLDGFAVDGAGAGVKVSGPVVMRNGTAIGGTNPIYIDGDCSVFSLENVEALNATGAAMRISDPSTLFARNRRGSIRACKVAGGASTGISLDNIESCSIDNCQIGYNTAFDAANEATQLVGVNCGSAASGVVCTGNYVTTSAGALAYSSTGSGDRANQILTARGTSTFTAGGFMVDGKGRASAAQIADKTSAVNTINKYADKDVVDSSNNRIMRASGSVNTDTWWRADGAASVTPV